MRWEITGADTTIEVEAPTKRDAILAAKAKGVRVLDASPIGPPDATASATAASRLPDYPGIESRAQGLSILSGLVVVAGVLAISYGAVAFFMAWPGVVASLIGGAAAIVCGAALSMLGQMGLALRDIARNSFRR
jgi:hypothetical protein